MEKIFNYPFAKDGDRNTAIPEANAQDNSVSMQSGWTLPYELNPANGGKYIERKDMNEILFRAFDGINQVAEAVDKWTALTTENLNDIKQAGRYFQRANRNATNERNYPANFAGHLIVLNNGINSWSVTQIYKIWDRDKVYIRRTTSETDWSNWDSLVLTSEFNNAITSLQNTDTNLNNNKEDKTYYSLQYNPTLNAVKDNRFYAHGTNYTNAFNTYTNYIFNIGAEKGSWVRQISFPCTSNEIGVRRITTKNDMNSWSAWDSLMLTSTANSTYRKIVDSYTKTETNNLLNQKEDKTKISTKDLDNENLNNINSSGFYRQTRNAKATTALNYPKAEAGTLIVLIPNGSGSTYLTQIYIVKDGNGIFTRARRDDLSWTDWEKLALKSEVDLKRNISDSYSKSEVYTKSQCDSTFLTIANANSTYRKIADSYTKAQCDSTFLTKTLASSTYRTIADSYTKTQCNNTFLTIANANSTYRKIADSYTKTETNNLMVAGGYSRNGYTAENIANATISIPNRSIITGCCIMITGIYNMGTNGPLDTDFIFKVDGVEIGRINLYKNGQTGEGIGTFHLINQEYFSLMGKLGKTIIPSIQQNQGSITKFNFLVVWQ